MGQAPTRTRMVYGIPLASVLQASGLPALRDIRNKECSLQNPVL